MNWKKIMKPFMIALAMLCFFSTIHAYTLNGLMIDNNDGTYEVILNHENGTTYTGMARLQGDGTLSVDVAIENRGSEQYLGVATLNQDGTYALKLRNNLTGYQADGVMSVE